ncbi:MAG: DUF3822 family protein [Bacteroidales bacterium]
MPLLEVFDETLDINSTGNYILSLQTSHEELSYCISDTIRNRFILLRSYTPEENSRFNHEQISDIIAGDDFLGRKYNKTFLVMPSAECTLVPSPLYDPAKRDEYFHFNHGEQENKVIIANKLPENDSYLIFSVSKPLYDTIISFFPGVFPFHHLRPLFNQMVHAMKSQTGHYIHLHIENDFFNLAIFRELKLQYLNAFTYRNISDIMYFVLNVIKTLGIQGDTTVNLSGVTERYDDLNSTMSLYIKNINFVVPAGNFSFSHVFNDIPLHRFINLFSIVSCE